MNVSHFNKHLTKIISQRKIFFALTILLSITVLLQSFLLMGKTERTIIVPTNGSSYWVENNTVDPAYLEQMGVLLSGLVLNRTPADVDWKTKTILTYAHPGSYHAIRDQLTKDKYALISQDQSYIFQPLKHTVNKDKLTYTTQGETFIFIGRAGESSTCLEKTMQKYTLQFACQNGKLLLSSLKKESIE